MEVAPQHQNTITSEAGVKLTRVDWVHCRDEGAPLPMVTMQTRRRNYRVAEKNLIKFSAKYQRLVQTGGRVPMVVDLTAYEVSAVRAFVDALSNVNADNIRMDSCKLNDVITLIEIFEAEPLLVHVIKCLRARMSSGNIGTLVNALILTSEHWALACIPEWRVSLLKLTIRQFDRMRSSFFYGKIPLSVMTQVFSSCELLVDDVRIAEWAVDWVCVNGSTDRDERAMLLDRLFLCVRSAMLKDGHRDEIRNYIEKKGFDEETVRRCMSRLRETRNYRCCVIKSHIDEKRPRCGIPNDPTFVNIDPIDLTVSYGEEMHTAEEEHSAVDLEEQPLTDKNQVKHERSKSKLPPAFAAKKENFSESESRPA